MDHIEGLPMSSGYDMILVIVCCLTKMALFIATQATDMSEDLAKLYLCHVFSKHGVPSDIVSDRGKTFVSDFWSSLCHLLHIKWNLSTAYHPETDGQMECLNQILEQYLWIYVNYDQDDGMTFFPLRSLPTTTLLTLQPTSLPSLQTKVITLIWRSPMTQSPLVLLSSWPKV